MSSFFASAFGRREKTLSECSDDANNSGSESPTPVVGSAPVRGSGANNLTMGTKSTGRNSGNFLYDIDGKFAYSYYEKKPELYDIDGKTTYKYFNQLKRLNSEEASGVGGGASGRVSSSSSSATAAAAGGADKITHDVFRPNTTTDIAKAK